MTDLAERPPDAAPDEIPEPEPTTDPPEYLNRIDRLMNRPVSRRYKWIMGTLAVLTTVGVFQNIDEFEKWESYDSENFYPSVPPACTEYVDMNRDLSTEIPLGEEVITDVSEVQALVSNGGDPADIPFSPDVTNVVSASEDFETSKFDFGQTSRQVRDFFEHHIESFTLPTSGLQINIYSSVPDPGFTVNHDRFDTLFHASLDQRISMEDPHFDEMTNCMQSAFNFPAAVEGQNLDVYVLPELGYCLASGRYSKITDLPQGTDDCNAQGFTPPTVKFEFLLWDILNEDIMMITYRDNSSVAEINRLFAHEAGHYWHNQMGGAFEVHPEERFIKALTLAMQAYDIAEITTSSEPVFEYR